MGFTKRYETVRAGWRAVLCIREGLCQCEREFALAKMIGQLRGRVEIKALASWLIVCMIGQIILA